MTKLLKELGIHNQDEIDSRYEIMLESYCKTIKVEAKTALRIVKKEIYPACVSYLNKVAITANNVKNNNIDNSYLIDDVKDLSSLIEDMKLKTNALENALNEAKALNEYSLKTANIFKDKVLPAMEELRCVVDTLEDKVSYADWPIPSYIDLLFDIN